MVAVSIVSAFFVGGIFASGLGAMAPILQLLITGDTIQNWIDRKIVDQRAGIQLLPEAIPDQPAYQPFITRLTSGSPADVAGVKPGWYLDLSASSPAPMEVAADPSVQQLRARSRDGAANVTVPLKPISFHMELAHRLAGHIPADPLMAIATVFGIIASLALFGNCVRFFQEYLSDKSAIYAVNDVRRQLYDHVLHMPLRFFGVSGTSDVTSRLVQDCQALQEGFKMMLGQLIQAPIMAAFGFALSLAFNWKLTFFIVLFAPLMVVTIRKFGKKMRRASRAAFQRASSMLGQIEASLVGIRVVKAAIAERFERRRYTAILGTLRAEQLKMARYEAYATPAMEVILLMVVGVVLMVASYMILRTKSMNAQNFIMLMACLASIVEPLRRLSKLTSVLARSDSAAARIFEILDAPVERQRRNGQVGPRKRIVLPPIQTEVRFEGVTFSYPNAPNPAVAGVDLIVPRGKSVAIVGRNGSGKTTLMGLLPRFFDPDHGRVLIDGTDVRYATLRSLRRQISVVTQDSVIFPGTIAENIAYGMPRASRDQIEQAARRAFAHDFIMEKPQHYDTSLDGLGGQLSGGQKQRLNIARAILREAPLLILDEATSQVDAESEHLIQQAINELIHERTTFVIAHRFSTILSADWIVVMERGRIDGQGKHEELLKNCETYHQLYERQMFG
jgi:ABC-type multidrug transport system fused ATPase/permease subunit